MPRADSGEVKALPLLVLSLLLASCGSSAYGNVGITTSALPNGTVGQSYSGRLDTKGGCSPYSWRITSGGLPSGLVLPATSALAYTFISGVPTAAGASSFSVQVTGCGHHTSTRGFTVSIAAATPPVQHSVALSWSPSSTSGVTYNVMRSTIAGGYYAQIASGLTSTTYSDASVSSGTTYYYVVAAQDSLGTSANSNQASAIIP